MNILLAIDGSSCSEIAVAELARRPWPVQSKVHVVTVDVALDRSLLKSPGSAFDELVHQQRNEAYEHLQAAAAVLAKNESQLQVSTALLEGVAKDAIITEAERFGADLVVVGSHGYGPIRRYFLGSVSQFVANNAPCSVLIVR